MGRPESFSMIYCGPGSPEEDYALLCDLFSCCLQLLPRSSTLFGRYSKSQINYSSVWAAGSISPSPVESRNTDLPPNISTRSVQVIQSELVGEGCLKCGDFWWEMEMSNWGRRP